MEVRFTTMKGVGVALLLIAHWATAVDYRAEAPGCADALEIRLNSTSCKADKLADKANSAHFPTGWTSTLLDTLKAGVDGCRGCQVEPEGDTELCSQCHIYCETLDSVQDTVDECELYVETSESAAECTDTFKSRLAYVHDKQNDFLEDMSYPSSWFASLISEMLDASEWCSRCSDASTSHWSKANCERCSATCQLTHAYTAIESIDSAPQTKEEEATIMGFSPQVSAVARVMIWVAKQGAIATGIVAAMAATLMLLLIATRSIDRRMAARRRTLERENQPRGEAEKLIGQAQPHYTELS